MVRGEMKRNGDHGSIIANKSKIESGKWMNERSNEEHKTATGWTKNRLRARERETKRKKASKGGILLFGEFHHQVVGIGFSNRNKAVAKSHL